MEDDFVAITPIIGSSDSYSKMIKELLETLVLATERLEETDLVKNIKAKILHLLLKEIELQTLIQMDTIVQYKTDRAKHVIQPCPNSSNVKPLK